MVRIVLPVDEIVRLYIEEKVSVKALSIRYGVSRGTIKNRLRERGASIRGLDRSQQIIWDKMTPAQREAQYRAAHEATRGKKAPKEKRIRDAIGKQRVAKMSLLELKFAKVFEEHGIKVIPQYALDIYNLDFAIPDIKLAIEIDGGNWHNSSSKRKHDRGKEVILKKRGWDLIRININKGIITITTKADTRKLITLINAIYAHPSLWN